MVGEVGILNVGAGDTKLSFDPANPAERIRAARIVKDMLRRGYALLVEVDDGEGGKRFERATDFREETCEYIVADLDTDAARAADRLEARALEDAAEGDETLIEAGKPEPAAEPERRGRKKQPKIVATYRRCPRCEGRGEIAAGVWMKAVRQALGLKLREASELSGISVTYLWNVEEGKLPCSNRASEFYELLIVQLRAKRRGRPLAPALEAAHA